MDSPSDKPWSKRFNWAECREPYKTVLNTIASHWIEGSLTDQELSLEILKLIEELTFVSEPGKRSLEDAFSQVKVLSQAVLRSDEYQAKTPEFRRTILNAQREGFGFGGPPSR